MEQFVSTFSASGQPPKETCRQCRFRKVRCDGRHGEKGCGDCERLKFDCSFTAGPTTPTAAADSVSSLPSPTTESGRVVERRRTSKACTYCRLQKIRCTGGAPCLSCKKKSVSCVYGTDRRRGSRVASSSVAGTPTEAVFPGSIARAEETDDTSTTSPTTPGTINLEPAPSTRTIVGPHVLPPEIQELLEFYFNNLYSLPSYAFLHPQTTIRQCSEGNLDICLSYAISAVASHHKGPGQGRDDAAQNWIQTAEELIWKHLESPTLPRLQALLLIVLYRVETGGFQRAFMLSSLAARAAAAMRLNYERTAPQDATGRISREVRRRVMWSLKFVERYFCMGLPEFELCPVESIYLDLPCVFSFDSLNQLFADDSSYRCWEEDFSISKDSPGQQPERNLQTSDYGSYQLCVKLEMLRRDIVKLTRSLSVYDAPFPQLPGLMQGFEQHLEQVRRELPNGPHLTADHITQLLNTPWLSRQILVHLSYHQAYSDLYRILLRGYREAAPNVVLDSLDPDLLAKASHLSLQHATAIVDILATLNQQSQRPQLLEFDSAICGYHATRVLLFIAQFGAAPRPIGEEWALSRAELCMASLRRFFPTSRLVRPILDEMKRAITVFSCRSATTTPSRLASPGPTANGGRDVAMGLSAAARVRQRLAIHSLLRQADFTDEEEGSGERKASEAPGQWVISPGPTAGLDVLSKAASAHSAPSPGHSPSSGGDLWDPRWFSNGGFTEQWDPELPLGPGGGLRSPSQGFIFPWLQRWGGSTGMVEETA